MSRLRTEPQEPIATLAELLATARAMEEDAGRRYGALAERMHDIGNASARAVLDTLAAEGRRRAEALARASQHRFGRPAGPTSTAGEAESAAFDEEDLGHTRRATPYHALSIAVRNEERVFAFWSYVRAHATDPEVQAEAERLASEKLDHIRLLRDARRRAFHAMRQPGEERQEQIRLMTLEALESTASALEASLAAIHHAVAGALNDAGHSSAPVLARLAAEERRAADRLHAPAPSPPDPLPQTPRALVELALERTEAAVDLYFAIADGAQDERVVAEAQRLAQAAIERLALLRDALPNGRDPAPAEVGRAETPNS